MTTIKIQYPVVIHHDPGTDYGVSVPDLQGCISGGSSIAGALRNIKEAIEFHVDGMLADGDPVPEPQPIEHHLPDEVYERGIWALVDVELPETTFATRSAAA